MNEVKKMNSVYFLYWLQGSLELAGTKSFSAKQIKIINEHIDIVEDNHPFVFWLKGFLDGKTKIKGELFDRLIKELNIYIVQESSKKNILDILADPSIFPPHRDPWAKRHSIEFDPSKIIC